MDQKAEAAFLRAMVEDVIACERRALDIADGESRRTLIRAVTAAFESLVEMYKQHVLSVDEALEVLDDQEKAALQTITYSFDDRGRLRRLPKPTSPLATLRALARLAERMTGSPEIDFAHQHWEAMQATIAVRNRITHPKSSADIMVRAPEVETAMHAFAWICRSVVASMDSLNGALAGHVDELRHVHKLLTQGDPTMLALYDEIKRGLDEQN